MIEIGLTFFILLFFIFPVPGVAVGMGLWTFHLIYKKSRLLNRQPRQWKKIVWLHLLTGGANTLMGLLMGLLLSLTVYFLIYESLRLLIFNFLFCFMISFRWFDFTYRIYQSMILKMKSNPHPPHENSVFVMITGQRSGTGLGLGMSAVSLDSGYLYWDGYQLVFDGVIARRLFSRHTVVSVEKMSSEKIKIVPARRGSDEAAEAWVIIIRQQFYPFKTKDLRNEWFDRLAAIQPPRPSVQVAGGPLISPLPAA